MQLQAQQDGTITKTETLTADDIAQQIADHQAAIAGAEASIKSFIEAKSAEIAEHQAELDILMPVKADVDVALQAIAAPMISP